MLLNNDQFKEAFTGFERFAFRVDWSASPTPQEVADFERYRAGDPVIPTDCEWLKPWLQQLADWTYHEKSVTRVRVLARPMTEYQAWLLWGAPWMTRAGEDIWWTDENTARRLGLPEFSWWLFDNAYVIEMRPAGHGKTENHLVTDKTAVARYNEWRTYVLMNSTQALDAIA